MARVSGEVKIYIANLYSNRKNELLYPWRKTSNGVNRDQPGEKGWWKCYSTIYANSLMKFIKSQGSSGSTFSFGTKFYSLHSHYSQILISNTCLVMPYTCRIQMQKKAIPWRQCKQNWQVSCPMTTPYYLENLHIFLTWLPKNVIEN